ncbi:MAG: porin family protein, partial [Alphaproteobacteria bacterium]|nr:porin family protein [Alphaproteobacteria bacterium]
MIYRKLTLSAALVAFAGTAFAADQGLYIGAGFGYNKPRDENFSGAGTAGGSDKVSYDRGWVGMLNLGHAYGNGFRSEVELSQRNNGSDKVNGQGGSGDTIARALMLNGIYDISLGSSFVPYVGLGLGYASVKADNLGTFNGTRTVNDSDRSLAFQGILGVGFEVSDNLRLGLDYRYFGTRELDLKNSAGGGVDADYRTHSVMASLRYLFTPARMAAAPAPMAA